MTPAGSPPHTEYLALLGGKMNHKPVAKPTALRRVAFTLMVVAVMAAAGSSALGDGFADTATPEHYIADSSYHTWASIETSNPDDHALMDPVVDGRMTGQYIGRTDLSGGEVTYNQYTDAYWYMTASTPGVADTVCKDLMTQYWPDKCGRARIRFEEVYFRNTTDNDRKQGACHELGHTVGFDDSIPENNTGCMSGGPNGTLSTHEINHINYQY